MKIASSHPTVNTGSLSQLFYSILTFIKSCELEKCLAKLMFTYTKVVQRGGEEAEIVFKRREEKKRHHASGRDAALGSYIAAATFGSFDSP